MELLYLVAALGAGAGLALAVGPRHGVLLGLLAFIGGVTAVFMLLALAVAVAGRCGGSKRGRGSKEAEESEPQPGRYR
jgi:hypothetical protein